MIFVDTNVFMYAVGDAHPLRDDARGFFRTSTRASASLVTSAEVAQELLHAYLPVGRREALDAAWQLVRSVSAVWSVDLDDVEDARSLAAVHPQLSARDLVRLSCCRRRRARGLQTYDEALRAAWAS